VKRIDLIKSRDHKHSAKAPSIAYCLLAYSAAGAAAFAVAKLTVFRSPLATAALADMAAMVIIFLFSLLADNSSVYDPYWSLAPVPITIYWLLHAVKPLTPRNLLILSLLVFWSCRLTGNWLRGWRGLNHEDWRYNDFRAKAKSAYWMVSFFGFHFMPTLVVFLGLIPVYLSVTSAVTFVPLDIAASLVTAAAIIIETIADMQLRAFRHSSGSEGTILNKGLWRYSRHPNYFGEVLFWWGVYLFALAGSIRNVWAIIGPAPMTILFLFISIPMMDAHLEKRNPGYRKQMGRKPMLILRPYRDMGDE
jgi:steroid 5-alpha reductase family enzyme